MADRFGPEVRSRIMRAIKSRGTSPERALLAAVGSNPRTRRFRMETHPKLPGTPDLSFPARMVAVFVDGCFWHGCPVHFSVPATNREFWEGKVSRNRTRDGNADARLRSMGWSVVRLWEHEVNGDMDGCVLKIIKALDGRKGK